MLKQYMWKGTQWQFEETKAPAEAVELKAKPAKVAEAEPEVKAKAVTAPFNKAFKGSKKK